MYGEHLQAVAHLSERARSELKGPDIPDALAYLWLWFMELAATRRVSGPGIPDPIQFESIEAWARLTGRRLRPWEVEVLRDLDAVWLTKPETDGHGPRDQGEREPEAAGGGPRALR